MTAAPRPPLLPSAVRWVAAVALSVPWSLGIPLARARGQQPRRRWMELGAGAMRHIFGMTCEVVDHNAGRYAEPPYLFVILNQTSLAENLCGCTAPPVPFTSIVNLGFALLPGMGWASVLDGAAVLVRQQQGQPRRALRRVAERMRRGESFAISIEGDRSPDGRLLPYKKGPVVLAIEAGATIVPIWFRGARERLPYGEWRVRPGHVRADLLESIPTRGLNYADRGGLVQRLRALAEREQARDAGA